MNDVPSNEPSQPATIDVKRETAHSAWKTDPVVGFDQRASLAIAQWVLVIFGGVYVLAFVATFVLFWKTDATFEKGSELVKFMIQSLLPLVTLAVGYYLGDRARQQQAPTRRR